MVDLARLPPVDATNVGAFGAADRRWRIWYFVAVAVFLIGPGLAALVIMGVLKAP